MTLEELNNLEALAKAVDGFPDTVQPFVSTGGQVVIHTFSMSPEQVQTVANLYDAANPSAILELIALARRSVAPVQPDDDALIEDAVKRNNVYGVLPNSASTMSIGRAVLAAYRAALARAGSAAPAAEVEPSEQDMSQAARDVLAERRRQVEAEGWTPDHDDGYILGELARAAAAYTLHTATEDGPHYWPWPRGWWKPVNARRDLEKAGALIIAEIERLDRAAATPEQSDTTKAETCTYPKCNCPIDAPSDPNWCARGLARPSEAKACWSCKRAYTAEQRANADGNCPHCGVEIELDDATPSTQQETDK